MRRPLRALRRRPEVLPGLLAVAVFVAWAAAQGGFHVGAANPGGLFLIGLLAISGYSFRDRFREVGIPTRIALALLAAFVVWSFLSIAWADNQGIAWEGANRSLLYLAVFALFAILPWGARSAALVLGAFSVGVAALGLVVTIEAAAAAEPEIHFVSSRFIEPIGYHNASAALYLLTLWPALYLASRRELPWAARGVMLATAGMLVQLALIPQSRGALVAFALTGIVYLVLVPGRLRALLPLAAVGAVLAASAPTMLDVYGSVSPGDAGAALDAAVDQIAISALGLFALGSALGLLDRRVAIPRRVVQVSGVAAVVLAVVAGSIGVAVFVREEGSPTQWASERWDDFKGGSPAEFEAGTRLGGSLGTNRYDFWRVAVDEFSGAQLAGIGSDNFAAPYLRERKSDEEPLHPHSLPVRVLSQGGLIGGLLFAGFMMAALVAAGSVRWRRGPSNLAPGVAACAVVAVLYWLFHSGGDWLWVLPAISAPAFAWLALAGQIRTGVPVGYSAPNADAGGPEAEPEPSPERSRPRPPVLRWAVLGAAAAALGFSALTLLLPWMADRDVTIAATHWSADPDAASDRLERARGTNFLSAEPDLVAGTIAARLGREDRLREAFEGALERWPQSWYANLQLGAAAARAGDRAAAIGYLSEARRLNPDDPLIAAALQRARAGRGMSLEAIDDALVERVCERVGRASELERCR